MADNGVTVKIAGIDEMKRALDALPEKLRRKALVKPMNTTDLAAFVGADYRVVGFGIHDRTTRELDGKKRVGHMRIARLDGDYLEAEDVDADQATAICQGDSGGPGFIMVGGVEVLAGTHSYSIQGCFNPSGDARPDLYMTSFIQPYIDSHDRTCGADGQCVRVGCSADPDCQPCGADGTCATGCPLPDPDCPTAALGEICQADTQCMSGRCVAWNGDPHTQFCSQPCAGPADCPAAGMTCGAVPTEGMVCTYAGAPPGALGQACTAPVECAEYRCVDEVCTYPCDIPRGLLCPTGFTCDSRDQGERDGAHAGGEDAAHQRMIPSSRPTVLNVSSAASITTRSSGGTFRSNTATRPHASAVLPVMLV